MSHRPPAVTWKGELSCDKAAVCELGRCHCAACWGRACQAPTQHPGGARPAADSRSLPKETAARWTRLPSPPALLREGSAKGWLCLPHDPALLSARTSTRSRGLVQGPGQAEPRQLPLHPGARQGHPGMNCALRYRVRLPRTRHEQLGWLTPQTRARHCWELSFRPTARKGPGPGPGPVPTPAAVRTHSEGSVVGCH